MRWRLLLWIIVVLLAGGAVACGPESASLPPTSGAELPLPDAADAGQPTLAPQSPQTPSITVTNDSTDTICYVYIAPATSELWGRDLLGGVAIAPGTSHTFGVFPDVYDIKVEDCEGRILHASENLTVEGPVTWSVVFSGGPPVQVTLVNNGGPVVCYVRFSPSTAADWGEDWLDAQETVPTGSSRVFDVPGGTYDMRASDCDENPVGEQLGVALDGPYTWNVP